MPLPDSSAIEQVHIPASSGNPPVAALGGDVTLEDGRLVVQSEGGNQAPKVILVGLGQSRTDSGLNDSESS